MKDTARVRSTKVDPEMVKDLYWDGKRKIAFAMVAPAFVVLLFLAIGPMLFMFVNAFRAWKLAVPAPPRFTGLKNFVDISATGFHT